MEKLSEWGRLNDRQRFNVLALDIDRAIALADLNPYEAILFEQAREQCWHGAIKLKRTRDEPWPEPIRARLNVSALARSIGCDRRRLVEAKSSLLRSRILEVDSTGTIGINKQADEWVKPSTGKPRLSGSMLHFCAEARPKIQGVLLPQDPPEEGANPPGGEGANPPRELGANPPSSWAQIRPGGGRKSAQSL